MHASGGSSFGILHVVNDLAVGGAQRVVQDLARFARTVRVSILTLHPVPPPLRADLQAHGIAVESLRPISLTSLTRARRMLRDAALLHVHLFPSLYLTAPLRTPKIFTEHGTHNRRRMRAWTRPLERRVYRRYDSVVCISEAVRQALEPWIGRSDTGLQVIGNGVALDRFEGRARMQPKSPARLVMTGTFTRHKDQATLIRAIAALPGSIRLTLVGEGPGRAALVELCSRLRVEDRVEFAGEIAPEALAALLPKFDLYVQSSHAEGFGLAALEAMACGLPTLGSDVPGLAELIGDTALLFAPGDVEELAQRIRSILEDADRYAALSRRALARASQFDVGRMVEQYEALYAQVLQSRTQATRA